MITIFLSLRFPLIETIVGYWRDGSRLTAAVALQLALITFAAHLRSNVNFTNI